MKKYFTFLLTVFFLSFFQSQTLSISGKVLNSSNNPVENATVYLLKSRDSSIVNYTASSREGNFNLTIDKMDEPSTFRIESDNGESYSKIFNEIKTDIALGNVVLEKITSIDEVKITASAVKIKKDTIEFNAAAIKVRPDSKIEELLKEIPGVEIDNDGKITVNGKEVDQIMINGKPFFDKDGKIALQNIPADIIKSIQFTTTKTKEEELSGKQAKSNNATINFNIDEKKNKGFISRITAGYGSDKRYEGSVLLSYFKNDTKISLLASSNNINSQGFSQDEVFDSMGNGRNSWFMQGGSIITSGGTTYYMSGGNTKGIMKSTTIGFNYSDKFSKETDLETLSFIALDNNIKNHSKISRTTLLPEYTLHTDSEENEENDKRQYGYDMVVRMKPDSLTSIYFSPSLSRLGGTTVKTSNSQTTKNEILANSGTFYQKSDSENNSFTPNFYLNRKLKKKGRSVSANASMDINEAKNKDLNISETHFFQTPDSDDIRNQFSKNIKRGNGYSFGMEYTEPISDSASVSVGLGYSSKLDKNFRRVDDYDPLSGQYSGFNNLLSYDMSQSVNSVEPSLSFNLSKKKISGWAGLTMRLSEMETSSNYHQEQFHIQKNNVLPDYYFGIQYELSEGKKLNIYNNANFSIPTALQLTPYIDTSNPLIIQQGNPELKNAWRNNTYLYFNSFNMLKNINYYISTGFTYRNNDFVNYSKYDSSGKQYITYANISGNKNVNLNFGFTKTYKWKESKFTINPKLWFYYNYTKGFIDGALFTSSGYTVSPGLNLTYEIKDKLTLKPSYSLNYNLSDYTNYNIDQSYTSTNKLKLELTNYFFDSNFVIGNDFEYNSNSNIAPGFQRDFYFWNSSIGYSFYKKQFTAKVKVYDVLNQNQSVKRIISSSYIEDREDLILKRYVMFSLTMKLNKFAGKKQ